MFELVIGCVFIVLLLTLAGWFGWQQVQSLRKLRHRGQMSPEDFAYFRRQCYRRIVGSFLTVVLALMFLGWYTLGFGSSLDRISDRVDEAHARGQPFRETDLNEKEKADLAFNWSYLMVLLLVLFAWIGIACADIMAIRRYGMRHRKRIREDRLAMLRRQLPEWQRERGRRE